MGISLTALFRVNWTKNCDNICRIINEDMENRIAKLSTEDNLTEEDSKAKASEIELECVSRAFICFPSTYLNFYFRIICRKTI